MPIFHETMGTDLDELYGNLGQDLVAGFQSFTLDFTNMRFSVGAPVANGTWRSLGWVRTPNKGVRGHNYVPLPKLPVSRAGSNRLSS